MNIGQKLGLGFGIVLVLLIAVVGTGIVALELITTSNNEVIEHQELVRFAEEKEVDHFRWTNNLANINLK